MATRREEFIKESIQRRRTSQGQRYRAAIKVAGKRVYGPFHATLAAARSDRDRMRNRRDEQPTGKLLTFGDATKLVLDRLVRLEKRPDTIADRRSRFRVLTKFFKANTPLHRITPEKIEAFAAYRRSGDEKAIPPRKPVLIGTVQADIRALRNLFNVAIKKRAIAANPVAQIDVAEPDPGDDDDVAYFVPDEASELLARVRAWDPSGGNGRLVPQRDADIIDFMLLTGLRLREAADVTVRDVDLAAEVLRVRHGKRGFRTVDLFPDTIRVVRRLLAGRAQFSERKADRLLPIARDGIEMMLRRWAERLREPRLGAHALRRTCGIKLAMEGWGSWDIRDFLGHKSIATTERYVKLARLHRKRLAPISFSNVAHAR